MKSTTSLRPYSIGLAAVVFLLVFSMVSYAETVNYVYDEMNRLKQVVYDNGTVVEYTYDGSGNRTSIQSPDTAPPTTTASPSGGFNPASQSVVLTCDDGSGSGCDKIYYTTDGATPTTSSSVYSSTLSITATKTLKFFAQDRNGNAEAVKEDPDIHDRYNPPHGRRYHQLRSRIDQQPQCHPPSFLLGHKRLRSDAVCRQLL